MSEFRPIPGFEGLYEVSDSGQVRSVQRVICRSNGAKQTVRSRIRKTYTTRSGHLSVSLSRGGAITSLLVHQLVMLTFAGPRPGNADIRHLNGDPTDNRVENLAYGTRAENVADMLKHGKAFQQNKTHCPRGHAYSGGNLVWNKGGKGYLGRICRACRSASGYASYHGEMERIQEIADAYYAEYQREAL